VIPIGYFLAVSVALFVLGLLLFFLKRDLITMFMAIEVMLNAGNLAFLSFAKMHRDLYGQLVAFFVITVAAAEAAVGLAIILLVFRRTKSIKTEDLRSLKG
jgi:NADH-quinone oxidoreductase subunit K